MAYEHLSGVKRDDLVNSDLERGSTPLRGNVSETVLSLLSDDVSSLMYFFWLILPDLGRNTSINKGKKVAQESLIMPVLRMCLRALL